MDIRADIQGVRSIAQIDAAQPITKIGDVREETSSRLAQIAIGQQMQGTVEALLADGSFLVKLPDAAIRTNLPTGSKVGDALQLTLVATTPRPTFSLGGESAAAPTTLSATARLIDSLLQRGSTALLGKTPLVAVAGAPPAQLATALQQSLSSSGLFYESHLQQWANGTRPVADLLREPQNLHPPLARSDAAPTSTDHLLALTSQTDSDGQHLSGLLADPAADGTDMAMHPQTAQLVNLQLNTLDRSHVQWQGEVWPGQKMTWEVSARDDGGQAGAAPNDADAQRSWQSVVRFDLPTLGRIAATITLVGEQIQIQVRTADPTSAATLRQHVKSLADATQAAGLRLDQFSAKQDAQDEQA